MLLWYGKEHAQCVHEVLGVALLRSAAVGSVNRTNIVGCVHSRSLR